MKEKFKKSQEIKNLESKISDLRDELNCTTRRLYGEIQKEFEKQFGLVQNKTILFYEGNKYVYSGMENTLMFWVKGNKITKKGGISLKSNLLYDDWEKTGEEFLC